MSFRITNYRCVEDSGEVQVGNFKALVGKNESGKTASLMALHKFNPASPEPFNGLREFPRRRFHEFNKKAPVVQVSFALSPDERESLSQIDSRLGEVSGVSVTKDYAGDFSTVFLPEPNIPPATKRGLSSLTNQLRVSIKETDEPSTLPEFRAKLTETYDQIGPGIDDAVDLSSSPAKGLYESQIQNLVSLLSQDSLRFEKARSVAQLILNTLNWSSVEGKARKYILSHLPTFIYFENYAIIDSRIHLPSFIQRIKSGALNPDEKTAKTLFSLVKLDPERLVALGEKEGKNPQQVQEGIDERALLVDRASLTLTGELADLWQQRRNRVDFDIDGEHLRLWVTDNIDGSRIELEQRSKGFQWFLSFYVVFSVESELGHKNSILLLDEPGLHLHASAQSDLLGVLKELSQQSQLIYTTHSPFMVDMDALDSISTVIETKEGTKVSDAVWGTDRDALFPLQAALGYSMSQSLFVGKYNLVVEGITDYWVLSSFSQLFKESGRNHLDDAIVVSPAGGAQKAALLAAMLGGQKLKVSVMLDADMEGKRVRDDLVKSRIVKENHVIFVSDASKTPLEEMEVEDLLPTEMYLRFASEAYSKELGKSLLPVSVVAGGVPIRKSLEKEFEKRGLRFTKYRVARRILEEAPRITFSDLPPDFVQGMEELFTLINKIKPKEQVTEMPQPEAASPGV